MSTANDPRFDELVEKFRKEGYSLRVAKENAARIIQEDQMYAWKILRSSGEIHCSRCGHKGAMVIQYVFGRKSYTNEPDHEEVRETELCQDCYRFEVS